MDTEDGRVRKVPASQYREGDPGRGLPVGLLDQLWDFYGVTAHLRRSGDGTVTPSDVRIWANGLGPDATGPSKEQLLDTADAWERDLSTIGNLVAVIEDERASVDELSKRLEEAEKLLALTLEYLSSEMELYKSIRAALAGGEK